MSSNGQPEQTVDVGVAVDAEPTCVELVPVIPTVRWSRVPDQQMSRADFVTQLIATAEHVPQTRSFRRATPADARAAYRAPLRQVQSAGIRTRQVI
jgi:hypothetical protein